MCGALAGIGGLISQSANWIIARDMLQVEDISLWPSIFLELNPLGVLGGGMIFGIAQSTQFRLQGDHFPVTDTNASLPAYYFVLILVKNRSRGPSYAEII